MMVFDESETIATLMNLFVNLYLMTEDKNDSINSVLERYRQSTVYEKKIEDKFIKLAKEKDLVELQTVLKS